MARALKNRRLKLGISQRELAERAGVGTTTVFNLEQGSCKVQLDIFLQVLAALDMIPQQVLEIDGDITAVTPTSFELKPIELVRLRKISDLLVHIASIFDQDG